MTNPQTDEIERLMQEFYLSPAYDPKAARPADNVKAAIGFAIAAMGRENEVLREALMEADDALQRFRGIVPGVGWDDEVKQAEEAQRTIRAALTNTPEGEPHANKS